MTSAPDGAPGDLVVVDHVDKHFGDLHVLRDISLRWERVRSW